MVEYPHTSFIKCILASRTGSDDCAARMSMPCSISDASDLVSVVELLELDFSDSAIVLVATDFPELFLSRLTSLRAGEDSVVAIFISLVSLPSEDEFSAFDMEGTLVLAAIGSCEESIVSGGEELPLWSAKSMLLLCVGA